MGYILMFIFTAGVKIIIAYDLKKIIGEHFLFTIKYIHISHCRRFDLLFSPCWLKLSLL